MPAGRTFVGRDDELRMLQGALADALTGGGRLITLVGDGGIGKTRTTEELIARAGLPPDRVLWGRCPEQDGAPAYWPWSQALRGLVSSLDVATLRADLGAGAADVARVVPALHERLPDLAVVPSLDPAENRFRVFESVASFLRRAAARAPLLLVLDDLHWADPASLLLLQAMAPELRGVRMLVIGTYREQEMGRVPGAVADLARVSTRITLRGLPGPAVGAFVHATTGIAASERLIGDLHRTTEGNPFFLDELVRMLVAEGGLAGEGLGDAVRLPEEVRAAIRRSLAPLGMEERRLLAVAAVMGREFELAALQIACEQPAAWVLERLAVAAEARIVSEVRGTLGRYRFTHALIRETLYGDLAAGQRAQMHRQVGLALEAQGVGEGGALLGEVAHHFFHAARLGEAGKAAEYALRAAREAFAALAYEQAVEHFDRALQCFALDVPDERRELAVRIELGNALYGAGVRARARSVFIEAAARARALGDAEAMTMAALGYGWATTEPGVVDATLVGLLEQALAVLPDEYEALHATLEGRLAIALYFSAEVARRDGLGRSALERARASGDAGALCMALVVRQLTQWGPDAPLAARSALLDEACGLKDAHPELVLEARVWRVQCALEAGDVVVADGEADRIARAAEALRARTYLWHARLLRATRALMRGEYADGGRLAAEAMVIRPEGPLGVPAQFYAVQTFQRLRDTGGLGVLEEALVLFGQSFPAVPIWRCGLALLYVETGEPAKGRAVLDQLAARRFDDLPRDGNWIPAMAQLAEVVCALGDRERARWLYALLAPHAERYAVVAMSANCYGSVAYAVGSLATLLGDAGAGVERLRQAVAMNASIGARPWVARAQIALATALRARAAAGDLEEASVLLHEARATRDVLGMHALAVPDDDAPARVTVATSGSTPSAALRREGDGWTVVFEGHEARLRDARGLAYLQTLLTHPHRELHALDLEGGSDDATAPGLDDAAREAYAQRLADLREELSEAEAFHDAGRAEQARERIEALSAELASRVRSAASGRRGGAAAERARVNVTRALSRAVERITSVHPALGQHLTAALRTGTFCCYAPDPRLPIRWEH